MQGVKSTFELFCDNRNYWTAKREPARLKHPNPRLTRPEYLPVAWGELGAGQRSIEVRVGRRVANDPASKARYDYDITVNAAADDHAPDIVWAAGHRHLPLTCHRLDPPFLEKQD